MKQKDAVFAAITQVTGFNGEGVLSITKEQRAQVIGILVEGFKQGKISLEQSFDEAGLKAYTSGLVSNWIRKDIRFTDGVKYQAKNPGSRAGQTDQSVVAMRNLLKDSTLTPEDRAEIQSELDKTLTTIQAKKANVVVNYDALPEHLRNKFAKK